MMIKIIILVFILFNSIFSSDGGVGSKNYMTGIVGARHFYSLVEAGPGCDSARIDSVVDLVDVKVDTAYYTDSVIAKGYICPGIEFSNVNIGGSIYDTLWFADTGVGILIMEEMGVGPAFIIWDWDTGVDTSDTFYIAGWHPDSLPNVTLNPVNTKVHFSSDTILTATADQDTIRYWEYSTDSSGAYTPLSDSTRDSLSVTGSAANHQQWYRMIAKNYYGSDTTEAAQLTVFCIVDSTVTSGIPDSIVFDVYDTVSYGATLNVTLKPPTDSSIFVSGDYTGSSSFEDLIDSDKSYDFVLYEIVNPSITLDPINTSVPITDDTVFIASADNDTARYWEYASDSIGAYTPLSDSTRDSLTVVGSGVTHSLWYRLVVQNIFNNDTSEAAKLTVTCTVDSTIAVGIPDSIVFDSYGVVDYGTTINVTINAPVDSQYTVSGDYSGTSSFNDLIDDNKSYIFTLDEIPPIIQLQPSDKKNWAKYWGLSNWLFCR